MFDTYDLKSEYERGFIDALKLVGRNLENLVKEHIVDQYPPCNA